jgi:hypothetical protein
MPDKGLDYYRREILTRAREASKYGAIEGILYNSSNCLLEQCIERDGHVFSIDDAEKLVFTKDCRCSFTPYNSRWGLSISDQKKRNSELRADRILREQRSKISMKIHDLYAHRDIPSLLKIEKIYLESDIKWHPFDYQTLSDKFKKHKDYDRALGWIGTAIQQRMEVLKGEEDGLLASLYVSQGAIFNSMKKYPAAMLSFFIALRHYNWNPTKTLSVRLTSTLKKTSVSENVFHEAIETSKRDGFFKGLEYIKSHLHLDT